MKDVQRKIMREFGYYFNRRLNLKNNIIQLLLKEPLPLLINRPTHTAFHNLCKPSTHLPSTIKSLLGLGLNFCLQPETSSPLKSVDLNRFQKDMYRIIMFSNTKKEGEEDKIPKLYLPNPDWEPEEPANEELSNRCCSFVSSIARKFKKKKKQHANLLPNQKAALQWLTEHPEVMVWSADKNLGTCVIEREEYIRLAFRDHLSDSKTYRKLTETESKARCKYIRTLIDSFITTFEKRIGAENTDFILKSTAEVKPGNEPSFMYLTAKVHKTPLKTRPIISTVGSITSGLGRWIDVELKKISKHLPYIAKSSREIKSDLCSRTWAPASLLFTMDATSMYTNIHVKHALPTIKDFLTNSAQGKRICKMSKISVDALVAAIEIVMEHNVFRFGDTHWLQLAGTAMGTAPAPEWSTVYFAIWEISIISQYPELRYYRRYIDDGMGIWTPQQPYHPAIDVERWRDFQSKVQCFGSDHPFFMNDDRYKPLEWTFSERSKSAIFLDLNISLLENGNIQTRIYEKPMNLYLYLPSGSCHSPGVLKGLVHGAVRRAYALCSDKSDIMPFLQKTFKRLTVRGHSRDTLKPIFEEALQKVNNLPTAVTPHQRKSTKDKKPLKLHLPFNPADVKSREIQQAFRMNIMEPPDGDHISKIDIGTKAGGTVEFDRLTICYHGQKKLGAILAPRKLRLGPDYSVNAAINALQNE